MICQLKLLIVNNSTLTKCKYDVKLYYLMVTLFIYTNQNIVLC